MRLMLPGFTRGLTARFLLLHEWPVRMTGAWAVQEVCRGFGLLHASSRTEIRAAVSWWIAEGLEGFCMQHAGQRRAGGVLGSRVTGYSG